MGKKSKIIDLSHEAGSRPDPSFFLARRGALAVEAGQLGCPRIPLSR
jgi:hypothetical protein